MVNAKKRRCSGWKRIVAAALMVYLPAVGCAAGRQFRSAALPSLESGVNLILDGVVSGLFAAIEVEPGNSTSGAI